MLPNIFSRHVNFKPSVLKESLHSLPNPCRGWYQIHYFHLPQQPDFQELQWCLRDDQPLVMAVIHIGAYQHTPLDSVALNIVSQILDFFALHQKDVILRFTYDCKGLGLLHEPGLFSQVEEHIQQLSPLIHSHTETIFVLQGLFVGSWGEMHGSKFLSPMHLKQLHTLVESAAGANTWLAVRKPSQWRTLHKPNLSSTRMGLFDDGILGSETNLGTFGFQNRTNTQWEDSWRPEDELLFEEQLCRNVPHGGEVVCPQQMPYPSALEVLKKLRCMHISYLNCDHDVSLLDTWKNTPSPWSGISFYDYVGAHLGYRYCIRAVKLRESHQVRRCEITVENTGFAPCYEDYDIMLEIVNSGNAVQQKTIWDLRTLMAGTTQVWSSVLPQATGKLYLSARRKKDGRVLNFAHDDLEQGKLFLGFIR